MTQPYSVLIDGLPVITNSAASGSLSSALTITNAIGKRSTAAFSIHTDQNTHYQQNQQVQIYDQNNVLTFSGYIDQAKEQVPGFQPSLEVQVTCKDQHFLADKRVIAASYVNQTHASIAHAILTNYLAVEGVTLGAIYDEETPLATLFPGTTVYPNTTLYPIGTPAGGYPTVVFAYCTVSDALDALVKAASVSGVPYYWQIDQNLQFWFVPYTFNVNATVVDGTQIELVNNPPSVSRQNPQYRNTQYILGGVAQTVTQVETRMGDGTTVSWAMGYEMASAPAITVNAGSKTVGVKGIDSGKNFYYQVGDNTITQDSSGTKLISSDTLVVTYIGQYPTVVISQNAAQISYEASLDDTTGIIEEVETDTTIGSTASGYAKASQLLTRYAQQGVQLDFYTLQSGFAPGQLITVNLPQFGLFNAQMLIESVEASDQTDNLNIWYHIAAIQGPYDVTWVDFFSAIIGDQQQSNNISVGVSQTVQLLANFTGGSTTSASLITAVYACPVVNTTLYPATNLYPC